VRHKVNSLLLQRAVCDFGADHSFSTVPKKLREHYGIEYTTSSARRITLSHAKQIGELESAFDERDPEAKEQLIGEIDGCMVPIVETLLASDRLTLSEKDKNELSKTENQNRKSDRKPDRRKNKTLVYKEARLCLVHAQGSVTPTFSATFQDVDEVGKRLYRSAKKVGYNINQTKVHGVGDGAPWIANQFNTQFAANASAAGCVSSDKIESWMDTQKKRMKENQVSQVLIDLLPHIEADTAADDQAPVKACHRYISNRRNQLDYKTALEKELPIGSGEIESAHRYVIQKRLKIAGAWWKIENAEEMLALRVCRANDEWKNYWDMKIAAQTAV